MYESTGAMTLYAREPNARNGDRITGLLVRVAVLGPSKGSRQTGSQGANGQIVTRTPPGRAAVERRLEGTRCQQLPPVGTGGIRFQRNPPVLTVLCT
ncbi:hypothetical protein MRX96_006723 [Rhipicephalus microplus]